MKKHQIGGAIFLLIFGAFICLEARNLEMGRIVNPGPGFFPFWLGLALVVVSLALVIKSSWEKADRSPSNGLWKGSRWGKIPFSLAAMLLYAFFLGSLGYLLATFFLMFFLFRIIGSQRWTITIVGSLIGTFSTYILFKVLLQVRLPEGFYGM